MIELIIDQVRTFIKEQGIMAAIAIGALVFAGSVVWAMNNTLNIHVLNDSENTRLLRVICVGVANNDLRLRAACVDASYDQLAPRNTSNPSGGK